MSVSARRPFGAWVALIAASMMGFSAEASASALFFRDPEALASLADLVVAGRVVSQRSFRTSDGMRILTQTEVEVTEVLKGGTRKRVTLVQPGGEVEGLGQRVSGLALFEPDEKVLLFLTRSWHGDIYRVTGMAQGKYRLQENPRTRELEAVPESIRDAVLIDPSTRRVVKQRLTPLKLDALRKTLRSTTRTPELGR